jgi:type I restriction-modification system DNA methylase subunit
MGEPKMASRWDDLDASRELEQAIHGDLKKALATRSVEVIHNGTSTTHAAAGKADIELRWADKSLLLLVEVTKRRGAAAEGEFVSTTDHLDAAIAAGGYERYGLLFSAPMIGARLRKNFLEFNRVRDRDTRPGRAFMLDFAGLQAILDELVSRDPALYPSSRWSRLLDSEYWAEATDDAQARQVAVAAILEEATGLREELADETRREHARIEQDLKKKIMTLEDKLRDRGITGDNANRTLIYLTFMRLYEEKQIDERIVDKNRMTSAGFRAWVASQNAQVQANHQNRFVNYLLTVIREEQPDLKAAGLLVNYDGTDVQLHQNVTDDLVEDLVFSVLDEYDFIGSRIDILGVVFETLARRAEKDTRVGQFFTPEEVVNFCANIVDLDPRDMVLDPAVGTARFLIAAMGVMLDRKAMDGRPVAEVEQLIKKDRLFGIDIDHWVATIAKMNMYIHGDGKSNVVAGNGLVVGDRSLLPSWPEGVNEQIDVVLTNPPLGEVNFLFASKDWANAIRPDTAETDPTTYLRSLGVVPYTIKEEAAITTAQANLEKAETEIGELEKTEKTRARDRRLGALRGTRTRTRKRIEALEAAVASGNVTIVPGGQQLKGGALFIGAIHNFLRSASVHRSGEPYEWRGGRAVVVVDEAILNTPQYAQVRAFIREQFFVKAVFSLGRPAFTYLAHTDAKTSILYLIKKPDSQVQQQEPVFYDHAEKVGYSATGDWIGSDLPDTADIYAKVRSSIKNGYSGASYKADKVASSLAALEGFGDEWHVRSVGNKTDRLDYYHARRMDIESKLKDSNKNLCTLGDLIEPREQISPEPSRTGEYEFATIDRLTASIKSRGQVLTQYAARQLWVVHTDDIVVSGIDLVHGSVAVARSDVDGLVMSTEMFPYRVKAPEKVLPEYILLMLRTPDARALIEGMVTGTSNRTRLSSPGEILGMLLPKPPTKKRQQQMVDGLIRSHDQRAAANDALDAASALAAAEWET